MASNANIIEIPIETYGIKEFESNFRQGTITIKSKKSCDNSR